jgi:asparagine synthase (glutamine-hydrolysing)
LSQLLRDLFEALNEKCWGRYMVGLLLDYSRDSLSYLQDEELSVKLSLNGKNKIRLINRDKNHVLRIIAYDEYPFYEFKNEKYTIFIEGRIYNKSAQEIRRSLFTILDEIFQTNKKNYDPILKWIQHVDGEIIVYAQDKKTKQIIVFNDYLGRLPIYYNIGNNNIIISRSLKYIILSTGSKAFSKHSIAQYLLFGYSLSDNTLFSDIKHLKPSSLIHITPNNNNITVNKIKVMNYSEKIINYGNQRDHVEHLSKLFADGCKNRSFENYPVILSLSGGLDSRIVAGGLYKSNIEFNSTTLQDPWKVNNEEGILEVKIAKEVAIATKSIPTIVKGELARGKDFIDMLNYKDGTNHLGFSYLLRYLNNVQNKFGSKIVFFTGDGGDKVIKYQLPSGKLNSYSDLLNYIIKIHKRFNLANVSKLTGIKEDELQESIVEYLKSYPEKKFKDKYIHFIFNERVHNWLFEGEDRNRHFFWSVTPFYSLDFFLASMETPHKMKKRNKLYIDILNALMPKLNDIVYANLKWPVNSIKSKTFLFTKDIYNTLPNNYRSSIRKAFKKESELNNNNNETIDLLKEQIINNEELFENYLNLDSIYKYNQFNSDELKMMLNLVSTMEHLTKSNITLENYLGTEFSFR